MLILLAPPPPPSTTTVAHCGPPAPALKGLAPRSASFSLTHASKAALREMPGAVVVVEEEGPAQMSKEAFTKSLLKGKLRLMTKKELPVFPATPPMPRWMDPNVTVSGGNVVGQSFPIGWGY